MTRLVCLAVLLAACGIRSSTTLTSSSIECGADTCGPTQYCAEVCTCCGIPDAGPPTGYEECRPMPRACLELDGDALRACLDNQTGGEAFELDEPRLVSFPCA